MNSVTVAEQIEAEDAICSAVKHLALFEPICSRLWELLEGAIALELKRNNIPVEDVRVSAPDGAFDPGGAGKLLVELKGAGPGRTFKVNISDGANVDVV